MKVKLKSNIESSQTSEFLHLFKGKLIDLCLIDTNQLNLKLLAPINVNEFATGEKELFDEITLSIHFKKLIAGTLDNSTSTVQLEENEQIFNKFKNRFFQGDFGHPSSHCVNDMQFSLFVEVQCSTSHENAPIDCLILTIPEAGSSPHIRIEFIEYQIFDNNYQALSYSKITNSLKVYYEDEFIRTHERMQCDWEYLYGIKKSYVFYQNQLKQHAWFLHQFNRDYGSAQIDRSIGEMSMPCWVEVDPFSIKKDDYNTLEEFRILNATKRKKDLQEGKTYFWLVPQDDFTIFTIITNELINSTLDNPFEEVIGLYFSQWLPSDSLNKSLIENLRHEINSNDALSNHQYKESFFIAIESNIEERNLHLV